MIGRYVQYLIRYAWETQALRLQQHAVGRTDACQEIVVLKRTVCDDARRCHLLRAGVLRDGLRPFADGVLGELARQQQADGRLDFAARDRRATVVVGQARCLRRDALEDVVDETVHDRHRLARDARVGMHLLQHLVDVDRIAFPSPPLLLLVARPHGFRLARGLLRSLTCWFWWHSKCRVWSTPSRAIYIGSSKWSKLVT